jgi:hypothetical protein
MMTRKIMSRKSRRVLYELKEGRVQHGFSDVIYSEGNVVLRKRFENFVEDTFQFARPDLFFGERYKILMLDALRNTHKK